MIPDFQTAMRPVLAYLVDGEERSRREVIDHLAGEFAATAEEREDRLPSGHKRFDSKVHWAVSHIFQAGLVERPARGRLRITDAGRSALATNPDRIDMKVLGAYASYVAYRNKVKEPVALGEAALPPAAVEALEALESDQSPDELIAQATLENQASVEAELLSRALGLDPKGFEWLVLQVLKAMGYGSAGSIEQTPLSGDGGIDGIISQDPLGLDRIYLQAKRYAPGHSVQRPDVQQFVGALMSAQGDRGVFLTTSTFSAGARKEAERVAARIELVDGTKLAQLMLRHGVGVQEKTRVVLYEIDEDFFDEV